ncbi:hypothetical protein LINGRAHAP2_LOCUS6717 [Linum grandiflorum]
MSMIDDSQIRVQKNSLKVCDSDADSRINNKITGIERWNHVRSCFLEHITAGSWNLVGTDALRKFCPLNIRV